MPLTPDQRRQAVLASKDAPIEGAVVTLLPVRAEHAEAMCRLRNQPRARHFLIQDRELEPVGQAAWIRGNRERDDDISWLVVDHEGRPVGTNALYVIDPAGASAEKGRQTVDEAVAAAAPYALEADLLVLDYAFDRLELATVHAVIRHDNPKVHSMNVRMGFEKVDEYVKRDVLHFDYVLRRERYDPSKLRAIVNHWRKRIARGKH